MTIEAVDRLLKSGPPRSRREGRLVRALRAALTGLLAANAYSRAHEEVAKAIDEIERELQG